MGATPQPDTSQTGNNTGGTTGRCACGEPATYSYEFPSGDQIATCDYCRAARNIKVYDETTSERHDRLALELIVWAHAADAELTGVR